MTKTILLGDLPEDERAIIAEVFESVADEDNSDESGDGFHQRRVLAVRGRNLLSLLEKHLREGGRVEDPIYGSVELDLRAETLIFSPATGGRNYIAGVEAPERWHNE